MTLGREQLSPARPGHSLTQHVLFSLGLTQVSRSLFLSKKENGFVNKHFYLYLPHFFSLIFWCINFPRIDEPTPNVHCHFSPHLARFFGPKGFLYSTHFCCLKDFILNLLCFLIFSELTRCYDPPLKVKVAENYRDEWLELPQNCRISWHNQSGTCRDCVRCFQNQNNEEEIPEDIRKHRTRASCLK